MTTAGGGGGAFRRDDFDLSGHAEIRNWRSQQPTITASELDKAAANLLRQSNEWEDEEERRKRFHVPNEWIRRMHDGGILDHLYHLGMKRNDASMRRRFSDVRFVCVGGTPNRMEALARLFIDVLRLPIPEGLQVTDMCGAHARYVMYKAGPVLAVSHGMGIPSISILLHEVFKLLEYSGCGKDVTFFRLGTCGGLGLRPGTVVISHVIYDGLFRTHLEQHVLGQAVRRPAILDDGLRQELTELSMEPRYEFDVCIANTLCTDDFYEGQARLDGALCEYNEVDKKKFLDRCYALGIRNIEMESLCFAAYTHACGLRAAVVCVTLLDRLREDQVPPKLAGLLADWQERPLRLVADYVRKRLGNPTPTEFLRQWAAKITPKAAELDVKTDSGDERPTQSDDGPDAKSLDQALSRAAGGERSKPIPTNAPLRNIATDSVMEDFQRDMSASPLPYSTPPYGSPPATTGIAESNVSRRTKLTGDPARAAAGNSISAAPPSKQRPHFT